MAEERGRTTAWCEEQRGTAARERRAAAKHAKERLQALQSAALQPPSRRERAEIASLQATVEKLRVEGEDAARRARLTERR